MGLLIVGVCKHPLDGLFSNLELCIGRRRRERQCFAHLVVAIDAPIHRHRFYHRWADAEYVLNGVGVFVSREPPKFAAAFALLLFEQECGELSSNPGCQSLLLGGLKRFGALGRHRSRFDSLQQMKPEIALRAELLQRPRTGEIEFRLCLLTAMAIGAVSREDRKHPLLKRSGRILGACG